MNNRAGLILLCAFLASCSHPQTSSPSGSSPSTQQTVQQTLKVSAPNADADTAVTAGTSFDWPVDNARITRGFLVHRKRPHLGVDLAAPKGTSILSAQKGTVIYAGRDFHGFGKMILVEGGDGWATIYAHLDKILVSEGKKVLQGELIGTMGRTGHATGVHLHFEVRKDKGPVDPLALLPKVKNFAHYRSPASR